MLVYNLLIHYKRTNDHVISIVKEGLGLFIYENIVNTD